MKLATVYFIAAAILTLGCKSPNASHEDSEAKLFNTTKADLPNVRGQIVGMDAASASDFAIRLEVQTYSKETYFWPIFDVQTKYLEGVIDDDGHFEISTSDIKKVERYHSSTAALDVKYKGNSIGVHVNQQLDSPTPERDSGVKLPELIARINRNFATLHLIAIPKIEFSTPMLIKTFSGADFLMSDTTSTSNQSTPWGLTEIFYAENGVKSDCVANHTFKLPNQGKTTSDPGFLVCTKKPEQGLTVGAKIQLTYYKGDDFRSGFKGFFRCIDTEIPLNTEKEVTLRMNDPIVIADYNRGIQGGKTRWCH